MLYGSFHAVSSNTWDTYVNVALNQPAWQSGIHSAVFGPNLAVDGNKNADLGAGSCSHTAINMIPPWWAVDLGSLMYVYGVNLTNRNSTGGKLLVRSISSIKYIYY
jgi:hypothetical protein